jgi:SAM-dependent methyltransferase
MGGVLPAYTALASAYDRALGLPHHAEATRAFEVLIPRYGIRFSSAADVGCGTGLFACYLARYWSVPVFAVDRSSAMLRVAACRCPDGRVRFLRQDIRDLQLPCLVDLITANFDTLNHLLRMCDLGCAFQRISANLAPGGHVVFDIVTDRQPSRGPSSYARRLRVRHGRMFQRIHWDPARRLLSIALIHVRSRVIAPTVELQFERAYSPAQVGRLLLDAGLVIRGVHDSMSLRPARRCPPRLLVVAHKPCTTVPA